MDSLLNTIFAGINGSKHILHLYAPSVNKYALHAAFLSGRKGSTAYVTAEKPDLVFEQLDFLANKPDILYPLKLNKIKEYANAVIDAATINPELAEKKLVAGGGEFRLKKQTIHKRKSIGQNEIIKSYADHIKRENYLNELRQKPRIMCTYDISFLKPGQIEHLVQAHDKLILTTDDTMILSSKSLSLKSLKLSEEKIEQFVKNELETIILALVSSNSMCGNDIKKKIYEKFNILLSSGTIYPLLHTLEKQGLLKCSYGIKTKTYQTLDEKKIGKRLNDSVQANKFLSSFIQGHTKSGTRESEE